MNRRFTAFETTVLQEVANRLGDGEEKERFLAQIREINLVRRLSRGQEINCYRMRLWRPVRNQRLALTSQKSETILAKVRIASGSKSFSIEVYLIEGQLFQLDVTPSPRTLSRDATLIVRRVTLWPEADHLPAVSGPILEKCRAFLEQHGLAPEETIAGAISADISVSDIPVDYFGLIRLKDGFTLGEWSIHGLGQIRCMAACDKEFIILAEGKEQFLGVFASGLKMVTLLDHEMTNSVALGKSFASALDRVLGKVG